MKKLISVFLSLAMAVMIFSGCAIGKKLDNGMRTVKVWTGDSHSKVVINELVNEFNNTLGKEMKVKIEYLVKDGESGKAIELSYETGDEPDFCTGWGIQKLSDQGKIVAIEDLPGGSEYIQSFESKTLKDFQYNGKTYKVPYGGTVFGLVYNKDMFKKYGIVDEKGEAKPPKTLQEVREYAKIMTNPKEQEFGIVLPLANQWFYTVDIGDVGKASANFREYDWLSGKYDFTPLKPIFEMYLGVKHDGSFLLGADGIDNDLARAQFSEGKIGMKFGASYDVGVYNDQFPAKCDWGVAPIPSANESERYRTRVSSDGFLMINKKAVDNLGPKLALEIFKWFHSDEMMVKLYQQGVQIPTKDELIKNTTLENPKHGWTEFAELVKTSVILPENKPGTIRTGEKSQLDYFLQDIWTEKKSVDDVITEMNQSYNNGMKLWFEKNPDKNLADYIIVGYDTKLR